jgi:hypothetical protein
LGDLKKDSSGRPYQMFGTTQDITDRKHGEEALRRSPNLVPPSSPYVRGAA